MPEASTHTNPTMFCLPVGSYHNLSTPIPKKNIKKALLVIAIFNSFKISISAIFPCHFDKPLISSLVEKDE